MTALDALGISDPFPIQASTIPVALGGADIIGQAKTGTGKTLAFGIPVLQRIEHDAAAAEGEKPAAEAPAAASAPAAKASGSSRRRGRSSGNSGTQLAPAGGSPQALIVVPTRELAVQVCTDLAAAGSTESVRVQALYGGRAYEPQVKALSEGIDVAVATPGRLLDLVNQGHLRLDRVRTLVLDEADEMLDLGFLPDVERIMKQLPATRQTMLFSATMPGAVISLARQYMSRPTHIRAADPNDEGVSVANIKQFVYRAHDLDKIEMLARILQARGRGLTMVFARTKRAVARITEELQDRHFAVGAVHGDLAQGAREQALRAFRNGKVDVLVATDVAARGIDVEGVTHVVNYQCPEDEKVYTHRIGRTGRAGRTGTSVTLVDWEDMPRWGLINKALVLDYAEPVELYSTSTQLFADLDIPEGAKGALPKQDRVRAGLDAEELEDLGETGRRGKGPKKAAPEPEPEPRRERTARQRRRTRNGRGAADVAGPTAEQAATLGAAPVTELFRAPGAAEAAERTDAGTQALKSEPTAAQPRRTGDEPKTGGRSRRTRGSKVETPAVEREAGMLTEAPASAEAAPVSDAAAATGTPALETAAAEATAATALEAAPAERPKRTRTRKRAGVAPAEPEAADGGSATVGGTTVGGVGAGGTGAGGTTTAETVAEAAAAAVAAVAESVLGKPNETGSGAEAEAAERPAKKRTRKRVAAPSAATETAGESAATENAANVAAEPTVAAAGSDGAEAEQAATKPARKRATRKATSAATTIDKAADAEAAIEQTGSEQAVSKRTVSAKTGSAGPAETEAASGRAAETAPEPKRARPAKKAAASRPKNARGGKDASADSGRGNSIRLAPGSLADPDAPAPEPVRPAPVTEPVELSEPVFTQEPILPTSQRAPRSPRKRPAKKSVAAQGSANSSSAASSAISASVSVEHSDGQADEQSGKKADKKKADKRSGTQADDLSDKQSDQQSAEGTQAEDEQPTTAILDAVNVGPVANRRRVQI